MRSRALLNFCAQVHICARPHVRIYRVRLRLIVLSQRFLRPSRAKGRRTSLRNFPDIGELIGVAKRLIRLRYDEID